jgi:NAD-dependent SIR2 family protein deacetylase
MKSYSEKIALLKKALNEADCILVGAGAGLSTAAGLVYNGDDFKSEFADFIEKYHFPDMYYGGFGPFENDEEMWAYWSRFIYLERFKPGALPLYVALLNLLNGKDYFVITTNVDHCFRKAGFPKDRLYYTQGDYGLFQCSVPCHKKTYDNENVVMAMLKSQNHMQIPNGLIPKCPVCGAKMSMNLRADNSFVQDEGWEAASDRYEMWVAERYEDKRIVYLELGVGENTPSIIKYPFWNLTQKNKDALYVCVNYTDIYIPMEMEGQSLTIKEDIAKVIHDLKG